jgi:hypothetical protein
MNNVIKLEQFNALEIPEEIILNIPDEGIDALNNAMEEAGFNKETPIWFATGILSEKYGLEHVKQGHPEEVIVDFLNMKNDGYDEVKLFIIQEI